MTNKQAIEELTKILVEDNIISEVSARFVLRALDSEQK